MNKPPFSAGTTTYIVIVERDGSPADPSRTEQVSKQFDLVQSLTHWINRFGVESYLFRVDTFDTLGQVVSSTLVENASSYLK